MTAMTPAATLLVVLKATLILAFGSAAAHALREHGARYRHRVWTLTFAALIGLPVLGLTGLGASVAGWR